MKSNNELLKKGIIVLLLAYLSPTLALIVLGAWALKYMYDLGKSNRS